MAKPRTHRPARRPSQQRQPPRRTPSPRPWIVRNGLITGVIAVALGGLLLLLANRASDDPPDHVDGGTAGVTGPDFHSLVADPTTPGRIFVGGHQAVSRSTDGGATWTRVTSLDDADAMGWGFVGDSVFVSGHPGLNRSDDGAVSFARINDGLPGTDVHAFGAGQTVLYGSAVDGGLFASTDNGRTWQVRSTGGTQAFFGRIVVDPADDDHVLAADARAGVAESTDGGRSWQTLDSGPAAATWLSRSPDNLDLLIASGPAGAAQSTNGGRTWTRIDPPSGDSLIEISPDDPAVLYAGIHDGIAVRVQVSRDGGSTWQPA
ncbi:MAG: WD40/YVTN/BNR-like repeat-containing protein [Acidimicrobiales bacterium]